MGVDGIDKADIFDEYFDDDKPKQTNYDRIRNMSIDEMAQMFDELNINCLSSTDCLAGECCERLSKTECINNCIKPFKQWLESEEV